MSARIIPFDYEGQPVRFNGEGWLHATEIAERFGKRLDHWLDNAETLDYIRALDELQHPDAGPSTISNPRKSGYLNTRRGNNGGTWLHPKLAVAFARWLDARFAVWCDMKIDSLLRGDSKPWATARREASIGYRGMSDAVMLNCEASGKTAKPHQFQNEAKLVNWVITGNFSGRDRNQLSAGELEFVTLVEQRNSLLIAQGMPYDERKVALRRYVQTLHGKRLEGGRAA
ncbi:KilA-N domain-containing protein [Azotobacter beijerinckii]|uniref:KilA-N domain-containing protein n=1 Tax=Azotobacter beijerinckii TaxID=170623 RepID=A0A1H6ZZW8_9GAMM|nr:KilA-N domain-containing protein [Azotobacter beijerinckii]SEJ57207.1 KilA-N domain-containing protein [Azotobacter beijerinckii]